ncbi:ROK family protein [Brachybacterium muris]|uniref:ROK family transcriptional regulator n=1 Tax=Brachybacterium muris TaxID=219301 RepID=UPI00223AFC3E|nr:ROK family transcriptional regulator [Brachybacterium muris]MCT2260114.1 ROK family protein [Brachybacterium muris]
MITAASAAVRQGNARACLLALRAANEPLTVAEVSEQTVLSRPTVDAVLTSLVETGPVRIVPAAPASSPGRPARRFAFHPGAATVAAVDIGDRSVRCLLTDAAGRMVATGRREYAGNGAAARLDAVAQVVQDAADEGGTDERLSPAVVGIAVPGILDADGRLAQSLAVKDLEGTDLASELSSRLGCPVAVENDIKLAAYAEYHLSARPADIAFVQIGHRISVALILGGRILQGRHRLAGELGTQHGMRWTSTSRRGRLHWSTGDDAAPLFARAADEDQAALAEIDAFCAEIAPRLATLLLTVDPEQVVIGGGLSRAGKLLLEPLRRHVHHLLTSPGKPVFRTARLTTDGALVGALGLAFEHGSVQVNGVPGVPPPWQRFPAPPDHPRPAVPLPEGTP